MGLFFYWLVVSSLANIHRRLPIFLVSFGAIPVGFVQWFAAIAAAVPEPEPETYTMMMAGLGLVGVVARRRKQLGTVTNAVVVNLA